MIESDYLSASDDILGRFMKLPLFSSLDEDKVKDVVNLCKIRKYQDGEVIIEENAIDHWMYVLISGSVGVYKKNIKISVLDNFGDLFGEMGVIDGSPRSATVKSLDNSLCLAVDASVLDRLSDDRKSIFHAVVFRVMAEKLSQRLRGMGQELVEAREKIHSYESKFGPL